MPLNKRFVSALITEKKEGVWYVEITYSYYGVSEYMECKICDSKEEAIRFLLDQRCAKYLSIIDKDGMNV